MIDSPHRTFLHPNIGPINIFINVESDIYGIYTASDKVIDEPRLSDLLINPTDSELCAYVDSWIAWDSTKPLPKACTDLFS